MVASNIAQHHRPRKTRRTLHNRDPADLGRPHHPIAVPDILLRSDFDFDLPDELIAQHPLARRSASRLLWSREDGLDDRAIVDLPSLLGPDDLLVFNDTRVIKARLFGRKESGGRVEVLVERIEGPRRARVQLRASHNPKPGSTIRFGHDDNDDEDGRRGDGGNGIHSGTGINSGNSGNNGHNNSSSNSSSNSSNSNSNDAAVTATMIERVDDFFVLDFDRDVDQVLEAHGRLPLPPYIEHAPDGLDAERYQTIWARVPGAVAAPTAGLHFDDALLAAITAGGVRTATLTLHVGAGTFVPVRVDDLSMHVMHEERYTITRALIDAIDETRRRGGRVVAVGTTSLRALESAADETGHLHEGENGTRLFITPGYRFKVADRLITNFHLPQSTLLMLVSAFAGMDRIRAAYRHAISERYRFFSYGDAMLIEPDRAARIRP